MRIVLFLFALVFALFAADQKKFVVGVENIPYYPHYDFSDEKSFKSSFGKDILDAFAKEKGYEFIYEPNPIKRLYMKLAKGAIDFKYPDNRHWGKDYKSDINVHYSKEVVGYIDGTMVLAMDVGNKKINTLGTVMGFTPWNYISDVEKGKVALLENANFVALIKQAFINRVDGIYANVDVINNHLVNTLKMPGSLVFDPLLPYTKDFYHLSTIKHPKIIKEFDEFLDKHQELIKQLKAKHGIKE